MAEQQRGRPGIWVALGLVLIASFLFVRSGRSKPGDGAASEGQGEPNVIVVKKDGGREEMPMETYIEGVVGGEMGRLPARGSEEEADWPDEAYAAQAILARSFAMKYLDERSNNEISAEHREAQAYNPDNIIPAIERGVRSTRGEVMVFEDEFVQAWFHSYSGGQTATASEGLQQEDTPYTKSVKTGENRYAPEDVTDWTFTIGLSELREALKETADVGEIRDVRIGERGPSRRVTQFEIVGSDETASVHGNDFRLAVGPEKMKSTLLETLEVDGDKFVAKGTGFGHGVGLSQWDTYKMAKDGKSPEEIVEFFFDGVEIRKLWD